MAFGHVEDYITSASFTVITRKVIRQFLRKVAKYAKVGHFQPK